MGQTIYTANDRRFQNLNGVVRKALNEHSSAINDLNLNNTVIVKTASDFGIIDSSKVYYIDGVIDMTGVTVEIPAGGLSMMGSTFDISKLVSTDDDYDMFVSAAGGCGNVLAQDIGFEASGASSQVWNLKSLTGFEAFEFAKINYNNCTKVGTLDNFRQGLELGTGRFGGTPSLELVGVWTGGYRITTSIVRSLDSGMTAPLFEAGAGFSMESRFLTDINCDLPASAPFCDFQLSQFPNPSTIQVQGAIFSRDGVFNAEDTNIFTNISSSDIAADFKGNKGLANTFVGGRLEVTTEVETTITTIGVFETLLGTYTDSSLSHFDSPVNGQLRHLGDNPREYRFISNMVIDGGANDVVTIRLRKWDDSASSFVNLGSQTRQINSLVGGRDVGFFTIIEDITLDKNDYITLQISNDEDTTNLTAELGSYYIINER